MTMKNEKKDAIVITVIALAVFAVFLAADLITKAWAEQTQPHMYLFPGCGLTIIYNSGMAFSLFDDNKAAMIAIICFTVLLMIAITILFFKLKPENRFLKIVLAIVEAGAIGNLVDRILWLSGSIEGVRDMIDVSFSGFGVCNLADFYVSFGGVILVVYIIFFGKDPLIPLGKKRKEAQEESEEGLGE